MFGMPFWAIYASCLAERESDTVSTPEAFQAAWIADLKSKAQIIALLPDGTGEEIRECEYQSDKFSYPNIRVGLDYMPSINGCGPDNAEILIDVFSEEKSSKEATHIASIIQGLYHKRSFSRNGVKFNVVIVEKINRATRSIYAWQVRMKIAVQGY